MATVPDIAVLVADAPGPSRDAVAGLIEATPGLVLAGAVSTLADLSAAVDDARADVVLLDDRLLRGGALHAGWVGARLVVTGVDDDPAYAARARRMGAVAWVAKEQVGELLAALRTAPVAVEPAWLAAAN